MQQPFTGWLSAQIGKQILTVGGQYLLPSHELEPYVELQFIIDAHESGAHCEGAA